jgi:transposase
MTLRVGDLHEGEAEELVRLTRSKTLGAGLVRRAQIVQHAVDGLSPPEIAARLDVCKASVRFWLKRFNARGLPGLKEEMRSGRPLTYTPEERSAVITAALSRPTDLDLPFACWTLDRLVAYLSEKGIGMKRSRISEILLAEGLKWRQEEAWFVRVSIPTLNVKGAIEHLHTAPPDTSVVVCVDEMGPQASKSYPGRRLVKPAGPRAERAKQEIDYGRRDVAGYVFGAFRPATGAALTATYTGRTIANWVDFLGKVERWIDPAVERVYAVMDNLNTHTAMDVLLFALAHPRWEFVFQPIYAAYLNLLEPWWKVLRSLALKGRRFEAWSEIERAVQRATEYWNAHKHPFVWGRRRRHRIPRRFGIAAAENVICI